jgi:hypothetical protein
LYSVKESYSYKTETPEVFVEIKYSATDANEIIHTDRSPGTLMREARIPRDKPIFAGGIWLLGLLKCKPDN